MTAEPALIVVGVDGTPQSGAALAFAIDEATRCGDSLELVTAWDTDTALTSLDLAYGVVTSEAEYETKRSAERLQQEWLDRGLAGQPQTIAITTRVVRGQPGPVLVEASAKARLLVVGTRALGPVRAAILGSVSRYCARHAVGALVVVPAPAQPMHPARKERRPVDACPRGA
jgi:nucleotide-binding universal stress UspA family protein